MWGLFPSKSNKKPRISSMDSKRSASSDLSSGCVCVYCLYKAPGVFPRQYFSMPSVVKALSRLPSSVSQVRLFIFAMEADDGWVR